MKDHEKREPLDLAVNRALFTGECQRLAEWALIGPMQRAALESFAERLLAAERERCASKCRRPVGWLSAAAHQVVNDIRQAIESGA